ncbi:hypothetical protein AYI70_g11304 [Smittium culicis]|uniref:Uncharacterized protein n=1 Tax=Smittium culicis TaxID=133412 RepID=A0A1R1X2I1_9FUNG|nr:hypothetical protein AYI70_g11304 [Smittium culicis]
MYMEPDINSGDNKIAAVQTRSQGPPKRTIRRFGQLDILADSSSEIDSISDGASNYDVESDENDESEVTTNDADNQPPQNTTMPNLLMP